jgi:hypothetical protein
VWLKDSVLLLLVGRLTLELNQNVSNLLSLALRSLFTLRMDKSS